MTELAIDLNDVSVAVPGREILEAVDWQLPTGATAAVLGPNGCGKSTLLRAITAYGHITKGTVTVLGEQLGRTEVHALRRRLGVLDPKLDRLLDDGCTAQRLVATGLFGHLTTLFDLPTDEQLEQATIALRQVGLDDRTSQPVETLSSGQMRRVWLARALVRRPELLILDEPAADLDLPSREAFLRSLSDLRQHDPRLTTIMVTHHLEDLLPQTSHVLLMSRGRIVADGTPQNVLTDEQLSEAFQCAVNVVQENGRWRWRL